MCNLLAYGEGRWGAWLLIGSFALQLTWLASIFRTRYPGREVFSSPGCTLAVFLSFVQVTWVGVNALLFSLDLPQVGRHACEIGVFACFLGLAATSAVVLRSRVAFFSLTAAGVIAIVTFEFAWMFCGLQGSLPSATVFNLLCVIGLVAWHVTASLPLLWWARRNRIRGPLLPCLKCGYELAGLPPDFPCPECGDVEDEYPLQRRRRFAARVRRRRFPKRSTPGHKQ